MDQSQSSGPVCSWVRGPPLGHTPISTPSLGEREVKSERERANVKVKAVGLDASKLLMNEGFNFFAHVCFLFCVSANVCRFGSLEVNDYKV